MARMGQPTPASVWAAATRTLSAFAAQNLFLLPAFDDDYPSVLMASSATANTYGSWVQIYADIGAGRVLWNVKIFAPSTVTIGNSADVQIGEGAPGAEAAVETISFPGSSVNVMHIHPTHRALSDNAAISVRVKDSIASAISYRINLSPVG